MEFVEITDKEMIKEWLLNNGYQGLCNKDGECGCSIDDLIPCMSSCDYCTAAYEFKCEDCIHYETCGKHHGYNYIYDSDKDWCKDFEANLNKEL